MPAEQQALYAVIRQEIEAAGPIPCARFMELALYHPIHGYYRQTAKQIGCQGDFYTSVSVGSLFGELLAFQFAEWIDRLRPPAQPTQLVEAGAHDGRLALDILSWIERKRPALWDRLEYWILEPAPRRREGQCQVLKRYASHCRWFDHWNSMPPVTGVILSNELLDAFPVHRIGWDATRQCWFEWRVAISGKIFGWVRAPLEQSPVLMRELANPFWRELPAQLLALLPDGFTAEICPAARRWWADAAAHLRAGWLLTLDYGLEVHEFLQPHRRNGTLASYRNHRTTEDPLANPGAQDITAHVNFSDLLEAGFRTGLESIYFGSQGEFLTRIVARAAKDSRFDPWTPRRLRQFQTLTHPNHLGRPFRVLIQSREAAD